MNQRARGSAGTVLAGAAAILLALLTLTGCSHASHDCSQGVCGVLLDGPGAHITIDADLLDPTSGSDTRVELQEASGDSARFTISGGAGTCTPNESLQVSGFEVTCRGIGEDQLTMEVSR